MPGSPFRVVWHHEAPSGSAHVVAVAQDHRVFPSNLPKALRHAMTFTAARLAADPRLRVFQFVLGVARELVDLPTPSNRTFDTVELRWRGDIGGGEQRLKAEACVVDLPVNTGYRKAMWPRYLDVVARCAFLIDDALVPVLLDAASHQHRKEESKAWFAVFAGGDVTRFPLAEALHFPAPERLIDIRPRPPHGFPSAPWYQRTDHDHQQQRPDTVAVVRAEGDEAKPRVAAVTKRYSWTTDDELWLLWMLDIVGVDHVILEVCTRDVDMSTVVAGLARHEGLAERVSLVESQVPMQGKETWEHLFIGRVYDHFVRWQADFDYVLLADTDEFLQLFDTTRPAEGMPRMDVKRLIALNPAHLANQSQIHFMRPQVLRSVPNHMADPLLAPFLTRLAATDGHTTRAAMNATANVNGTTEPFDQGKALFALKGALRPYLHYNAGWGKLRRQDQSQCFILHIRQPFKEKNKKEGETGRWALDRFFPPASGASLLTPQSQPATTRSTNTTL